jgi:sugar (pentulose or hexulose) kinase
MTDFPVDLTLVIDIGKSHAKLLMVSADGTVVERHGRDNASVMSPLGYPALDLQGLGDWMTQCLRNSAHTAHCHHVIASTHGAAFVALADEGVAWAPLDYEFDGFAPGGGAADRADDALVQAYAQSRDSFEDTLSPDLPAGLNAARQLFWMQHHHPDAWVRTRCLLPYPQYWAWWLSGVCASERSSLGCHTQLWRPQADGFTELAHRQVWAPLFAPLHAAWDVLGPVRPDLARELGLPLTCQVHVGVHDSNACLARYLATQDRGLGQAAYAKALTVVSSGTWTVLMAPGAPTAALQAGHDMLGNVDVLGRATPTARFMGGREFATLLEGADPNAGTLADLQLVIDSQTFAWPTFARQGGPFMDREGYVQRGGQRLPGGLATWLSAGQRSALAALYCAQVTAWLVQRLWEGTVSQEPVLVVEGPLAHNPLYLAVLQGLLPRHACFASRDAMEGTARGAWLLCHWRTVAGPQFLKPVVACDVQGLARYQAQWIEQLNS